MAKRAKATDGGGLTGVEAIRGNGYDPETTQEFVDGIEEVQGQVDEIMAKARDKCAPLREDINKIKTEAHNAGIPRAELNAIISKRKALKRAEASREKLNDDQKNNFDQLELALRMISETPNKAAGASKSGNGTEAHA